MNQKEFDELPEHKKAIVRLLSPTVGDIIIIGSIILIEIIIFVFTYK